MAQLLRRKSAARGRLRQLRACSAASPAWPTSTRAGTSSTRVYREAPSVQNADGTLPAEESRRRRGRADPARVQRLRAHARPGHRRRLLPPRLPAADRPDRLGRDGARRGEAAGEGGRARARRGALLGVPARRDEAGQARWCTAFRRPQQVGSSIRTCACSRRAWSASAPPPVPAARPPAPAGTCPAPAAWGRRAVSSTTGRRRCRPIASLLDADDEDEIAARVAEIADPVGTFYRYSLPASLLHRRVRPAARQRKRKRWRHEPRDHHRPHDPARGTREDPHLPRSTTAASTGPTSRSRSCAASRSSPRGGRAEDMPQITSRICGVCPMAHHMAATKALDDLYQVDPPPAGRKIRELLYNAFMVEDHALHFFFLGGPDFIVGPDAPRQSGTSSASSARWASRSARR